LYIQKVIIIIVLVLFFVGCSTTPTVDIVATSLPITTEPTAIEVVIEKQSENAEASNPQGDSPTVIDSPSPHEDVGNDDVAIEVLQGHFQAVGDAQLVTGDVRVFQTNKRTHIITLTDDFSVDEESKLYVMLSTNPAPKTSAELGEKFIELGVLKKFGSMQSYHTRPNILMLSFQSVVIYSKSKDSIIATARLKPITF